MELLWCGVVILSAYCVSIVQSVFNLKEIKSETCARETLTMRCANSQNIILTKAKFGHMELGRCIDFDLGHFGCFEDVLNILKPRCDRQQRCTASPEEEIILNTKPCVSSLAVYLDTSYTCVPDQENLRGCRRLQATRNEKFIISSDINQHCSSSVQPLEIYAESSMDIDISIQILNSAAVDNNNAESRITIVSNSGNETHLDVSQARRVVQETFDISSLHVIVSESPVMLLIGFRAVGCEDIKAPKFTWIKRERDVITIGCLNNNYKWQLKCSASKWIGFRGNCTHSKAPSEEDDHGNSQEDVNENIEVHNNSIFTKGIQYALTIGLTVVLCVMVVTTGYVCLKKAEYRMRSKSKGIEMQEIGGEYSNTWKATLMRPVTNDLNNPNASPPQQYFVLNQDAATPAGSFS